MTRCGRCLQRTGSATFADRVSEPTLTYEELLNDLKAHGKL